MGISGFQPDTVGWFEITATDPSAGKRFYEGLFGWRLTSSAGSEHYTISAPGTAAGMGALRRGGHDALCVSVVCADVAATIPRLEKLGATVIEPPVRTAAGHVHAVIADVRGNRLGLLEPTSEPTPGAGDAPTATAQNGPGTAARAPLPYTMAWFEIGTTDLSMTREFYEQAFGWAYERDEAAEGVLYFSILPGGSEEPIGGVIDLSAGPAPADYAIPGLLVPDVPDLLERCERAGGQRVMGPVSDANGLVIGQFTDPFGNRWSAFAQPSDT